MENLKQDIANLVKFVTFVPIIVFGVVYHILEKGGLYVQITTAGLTIIGVSKLFGWL